MLGRVTQANRTCESLGRDGDILWKTFPLSSKHVYYRPLTGKNPEKYRLSCLFTVKHYAGMAGLRTWPTQNQDRDRQQQIIGTKTAKRPAETKDPSGGTTGRVKLYGRWGGWALAPNTASLGRDCRSHSDRSRSPDETFKASADFFGFLMWIFSTQNYCAAR
jgi:hypothetical protein